MKDEEFDEEFETEAEYINFVIKIVCVTMLIIAWTKLTTNSAQSSSVQPEIQRSQSNDTEETNELLKQIQTQLQLAGVKII